MSNPQPSPLGTPMPWDMVSSAYAEETEPVLAPFAHDALRLAAPPPGARVVDVACGPGTLSFVVAAPGHPVDALDFSPQMIGLLERRLRLKEPGAPVTAHVGDGQKLPFADATYGAGFSMFGLMFFPDRAAGFRELRRVLVPGAKAVVSSWQRMESNPVLAAMFAALREETAKLMPNAPKPGAQEMPLVTRELCEQEMSAAFADVVVHEVIHEETFETRAEVWKKFERTLAPILLMRKRMGEQAWAPVSAAVEKAVLGAIESDHPVLPMPAWLTVGTAR